jgi:2-haloacid dehalogenase
VSVGRAGNRRRARPRLVGVTTESQHRELHPGHRLDTGGPLDTVVFDLGGVLIDWDPRHLYRSLFADEAAMEEFLATVCTPEWNAEQDRGRSLAEATAALVERHPEHAELIEAFYGRWDEMVGEPIAGTVALARELKARGVRLVALSNWSAETFPRARPRLAFLDEFEGVLVSGSVGMIKPDPAIFEIFVERHGVDPATAVFVDDSPKNVRAAADAGFDAIPFESPAQLRGELRARGLVST